MKKSAVIFVLVALAATIFIGLDAVSARCSLNHLERTLLNVAVFLLFTLAVYKVGFVRR